MGYQQGLSGLAASSNDLDVIGNNIANANTVGFKESTAQFADVYANSIAQSVNTQIGLGASLASVQQDFSQGTINTTGQALDVAINGNGFFQMSNNGTITYSRNGVFQLDKNGYITDAEGNDLMGYAAGTAGVINTAQTVPLQVPTTNIAPAATQNITAQLNLNAQDPLMLSAPGVTTTSTTATGAANITSTSAATNADTYTVTFDATGSTYSVTATDASGNPVPSLSQTGVAYTAGSSITLGTGESLTLSGTPGANDTYTVTPNATAFNASNSSTYNYSTSVTTYDTLGGSEQIDMYFARTGAGTWDVYAGVAGGTISQVGTATFNSSGTLVSTTEGTTGTATTSVGAFNFTIPTSDGSTTPQQLTLNIGGTTQYGSTDGVNNLAQDGYASGTLSNFSIGADGTITGNYSNGETMVLGQIVLANFNNPNGLVNLGGNQFEQTTQSGVAQISAPGSTNHGSLQGGALEQSNVDLTNQLVDLITAQRNYQANAQTIKTQQTVDQTLLQM
jgi:flagellar hook protein FlgE